MNMQNTRPEREFYVKFILFLCGIGALLLLLIFGRSLFGDKMATQNTVRLIDKTGDAGYVPFSQTETTYLLPFATPIRDAEVYRIDATSNVAENLPEIIVPRGSKLLCTSQLGALYRTGSGSLLETKIIESSGTSPAICAFSDSNQEPCQDNQTISVSYHGSEIASLCMKIDDLGSHSFFAASEVSRNDALTKLIDFKYFHWSDEFLLVFLSEQKILIAPYTAGSNSVTAVDLIDGPWSKVRLGSGVGGAVPTIHRTLDPYVLSSGGEKIFVQDEQNNISEIDGIHPHSIAISSNGCELLYLSFQKSFDAVEGVGVPKLVELTRQRLCH